MNCNFMKQEIYFKVTLENKTAFIFKIEKYLKNKIVKTELIKK